MIMEAEKLRNRPPPSGRAWDTSRLAHSKSGVSARGDSEAKGLTTMATHCFWVFHNFSHPKTGELGVLICTGQRRVSHSYESGREREAERHRERQTCRGRENERETEKILGFSFWFHQAPSQVNGARSHLRQIFLIQCRDSKPIDTRNILIWKPKRNALSVL